MNWGLTVDGLQRLLSRLLWLNWKQGSCTPQRLGQKLFSWEYCMKVSYLSSFKDLFYFQMLIVHFCKPTKIEFRVDWGKAEMSSCHDDLLGRVIFLMHSVENEQEERSVERENLVSSIF